MTHQDWKTYYETHTVSAEEAVKCIKSNDKVVVGHAVGVPEVLVNAMTKDAMERNLTGIMPMHVMTCGDCAYCKPEAQKHFTYNSFFLSTNSRQAYWEGRAEFTPSNLSKVPYLMAHNLRPDVALIQVTPPNEDGYVSLGVSVDYTKPGAELAKTVIAEVNDQYPWIHGDTLLHVSEIDYFVKSSRPIYEIELTKSGEVERKIAENVAGLIEDGSTLQLGIGKIPDAILPFLKDKKDLGIHSEMIADGVQVLVECGAITGAKKTLDKGKIVTSTIMGTQRFYDFAANNPLFELHPVTYTNDIRMIAANHKFVSINGFIEVDLSGQVNSTTVGGKVYSGIGGQNEFAVGAQLSEGGKSILAGYSTAQNGAVSRIVPQLAKGTLVAVSTNDVDYIVTEYGVAHLKGLTLPQRAEALINIAHPKFRDGLRAEAAKGMYR